MKAIKYIISIALAITVSINSQAQEISETTTDSLRATPRVSGMGPFKLVEVTYDRVSSFPIEMEKNKVGLINTSEEVDKLEDLRFKVNVPVFLRPRTKLVLNVKYDYEEYNFKNPKGIEPGLFRTLEDKHLNSLNTNILFLRSMTNNRFLILMPGVQLNGDYKNEDINLSRFLKGTFGGVYGWKKSINYSYGLGVYYNYDLGGQTIYPVFLYNKTFNSKWGVEAIFPANVKVRYNKSTKSLFYAGYELSGASYQLVIDNPSLSNISTLELRRSNVRFNVNWEKALSNYLWLGLQAGYTYNVRFDLVEQDRPLDEKVLIKNKVGGAPFGQVSLFVAIPDKIANKFKERKQ